MYFGKQFLEEWYANNNLQNFLEMKYPYSYLYNEEAGYFSEIDRYQFSLFGGSWLWNNFSYNGIKINDSFFTGNPLHKIETLNRAFLIDGIEREIAFHSFPLTTINKGKEYLAYNYGGLGDRIPFADEIVNTVAGHKTPQQRLQPPPTARRKVNYAIDYKFYLPLSFNSLQSSNTNNLPDYLFNLNLLNGSRNFLNYDHLAFSNTFSENYTHLSLAFEKVPSFSRQKKEDQKDNYNAYGILFDYNFRDRLFADFGYRENETATLNEFNTSLYYRGWINHGWIGKKTHYNHSIHLSTKEIVQNETNRQHNIFNITGKGLQPYYPNNKILNLLWNNSIHIKWTSVITYQSRLDTSFNFIQATLKEQFLPTYFQNRDTSLALYLSHLKANDTFYNILHHEQIFKWEPNKNKKSFSYWADLGVDIDSLLISTAASVSDNSESLFNISPRFTFFLQLIADPLKSWNIEIGRRNIPYNAEYVFFLSDGYLTRENYIWNDNNQNLKVDSGEVTDQLHSTGGGKYNGIANQFKQPHYYYIDIPFAFSLTKTPFKKMNPISTTAPNFKLPQDTPFSLMRNWIFSGNLHYRTFRDETYVVHDQTTSNKIQVVEDVTLKKDERGNQQLYTYSLGERRYLLTNLPTSLFPYSNNPLLNSPFYAGITLKISHFSPKIYFSFSLSAYLVNGINTYGNGSQYSGTGLINEYYADPNNQYKALGRYANDRAYIGRILFSYKILKNLSSILQIRYKDGEPFGSWSTYLDRETKQVAFYRHGVNGDNILLYNNLLYNNEEFGKREDNTWDFNLTFNYLWKYNYLQGKIFLSFYNFIDLGQAILEYALYDNLAHERVALELQTPGGIYLGITGEW